MSDKKHEHKSEELTKFGDCPDFHGHRGEAVVDENGTVPFEPHSDFEAALRSLQPRTDRLDSRWRSLLAKEASLTAEVSADNTLPSPFGRGAGGEDCGALGGHRFVCIHCGSAAPSPLGTVPIFAGTAAKPWSTKMGLSPSVRLIAWPAAFSTMTAVAAILLVMLVTYPDRQMAQQGNEQSVAPSVELSGDKLPKGREPGYWLASRNASRPPLGSDTDEMPYLVLRDQVLRHGVESWKSPASAVVTTTKPTEPPLSYRQQLDLLLKQQGLRGS